MDTDTRSQHTDGPFLDATFALLRDPRRRALVSILADRNPPVSLTGLATAVAARELETDDVPAEQADAVAVTLHHVHLPKLADGDIVTYDPVTKTVSDAAVEDVAPFWNLSDDAN